MAAASNTTPPKTLTYLESLYPLGLCDLSFNEPTTPTMGRHSDRHGRRHDRPSDFPPGRRQTAPVDQYGNWQHEEEDPYQDHADMAADHADQYYATYGSYQGQEPASGPYASPRTWPDYDLYDDHNGQYGQDTYTSGSMTPRAGSWGSDNAAASNTDNTSVVERPPQPPDQYKVPDEAQPSEDDPRTRWDKDHKREAKKHINKFHIQYNSKNKRRDNDEGSSSGRKDQKRRVH